MQHNQQVNLQTWAIANKDNLKILLKYLKTELGDLKDSLVVSFDHSKSLVAQGKAIQIIELISKLENNEEENNGRERDN